MQFDRRRAFAGLALAGLGGWMWMHYQRGLIRDARALSEQPLLKPNGGLNVYHLGHSLVGRDMPAMVAQLAGAGHRYDSQLGWGTSLRDHWEPEVAINGFEAENAHDHFRPAKEALLSGAYDAVVLTEMVEIIDAIKYHDSPAYLAKWATMASEANPNARIYLYETWHHTDDGDGWRNRIDRDLETYWQRRVLYPALAQTETPIHLIPAGQVMAAFVNKLEARGGFDGMSSMHDLFTKREDGTPDTIHFNDLGAYLVALTHFAVLYHQNPVNLPYMLKRADGTSAVAPSKEVANIMQQTVWDVIARHPETGVVV